MLIASAAMFFAVAGSAFVVRARMAGHCCDRAHPSPHVQVRAATPPPVATIREAPCGEAIYRSSSEGKVLVDFRLCPPGDDRYVDQAEQLDLPDPNQLTD